MKNILILLSLLATACSIDSTIDTVAPTAFDMTMQTNKNTQLVSNLMSLEKTGITFELMNSSLHGNISLNNQTGEINYMPNHNYHGSDYFSYKTWMLGKESKEYKVKIEVIQTNTKPLIDTNSFSINEDSQLINNLTGSDPDGDSITFQLITGPLFGSITILPNGQINYLPNLNFSGSDSFIAVSMDSELSSDPETFQVTVLPVNDKPVAISSNFSTNEDQTLNGQLGGSDIELSPLTYSLVSNSSFGSLTINSNGSFTYTPNLNYNGIDSFSYKVNDGELDSDIQNVIISVVDQNDLPLSQNESFLIFEDQTLNQSLTGTDVENNPLSFEVVSSVLNGSLNLNSSGNFSYTPNSNYNGSDSFTFRVFDGLGYSSNYTVSITISPLNDAPTLTLSGLTIVTNTNTVGNLTSSVIDVDSDPVSFSIKTQALNGVASIDNSGNISYSPSNGYTGPDSFAVSCFDIYSLECSNPTTVNVTVNNSIPVANNLSFSNYMNLNISNQLTALDLNTLQTLYYSLVSGTTNGSATVNADGSFVYTPNLNFFGSDSFTYKVNDGIADSEIKTVTLQVSDWMSGWTYRRKITINSVINSAQTNIPLAVKINSSNINYGSTKPLAEDIRFTDSLNNQLSYEIDTWNTSGNSLVWVKIPSLPVNTTNFYIWMYYGNSAANDAQNRADVWSNGYVGVWHLNQTSGSVLDSTSKNNHGTVSGAVTRNIAGLFGNGFSNASNNACIEIPHNASQALTSEFSFETIAKTNTSYSWRWLLNKSFYVLILNYTAYGMGNNEGSWFTTLFDNILFSSTYSATNILSNAWQMITSSYSDPDNFSKTYINGTLVNNSPATQEMYNGSAWLSLKLMGDCASNAFAGEVEEIRLSSSKRSDEWVRIQHLAQNDLLFDFSNELTE